MATQTEITNSILTSINTRLADTTITEDERGSLINQFEQITDMIRDGYQFSESDLEDLPSAIRTEVDILVNSKISELDTWQLSHKHSVYKLVTGDCLIEPIANLTALGFSKNSLIRVIFDKGHTDMLFLLNHSCCDINTNLISIIDSYSKRPTISLVSGAFVLTFPDSSFADNKAYAIYGYNLI